MNKLLYSAAAAAILVAAAPSPAAARAMTEIDLNKFKFFPEYIHRLGNFMLGIGQYHK